MFCSLFKSCSIPVFQPFRKIRPDEQEAGNIGIKKLEFIN